LPLGLRRGEASTTTRRKSRPRPAGSGTRRGAKASGGSTRHPSKGMFGVVVGLVAMVVAAMSAVAIAAIRAGRDGVITGSACAAMSAVVTSVLVSVYGRRRR